jgi:succinoglycan biosynthesis transport protein ExoP
MREAFANRPTTVADYLAIFRRRAWLIVLTPVVAAVAAFLVSANQDSLYRASATIYVNRQSVVTAITNVGDPSLGDPTRFLATEASIARAPELAARVVAAAGVPGMTPGRLLGESDVSPSSSADLLYISVSDRNANVAARLANTYATEFTRFTRERATANIDRALNSLQARIRSLVAHGQVGSPAYATLIQYQGQLETVGKLLANNTSVLRPAGDASKVRPRPVRDGLVGLLLGGVLGLGIAFLAEALDRRVRSEQEIEEALGVPLLARVPKPRRPLRKAEKLVMLTEPTSVHAETFRKLRTSIEFINSGGEMRTIMVTSAMQREGKSTTIANLAVAFARAGRRVALVDLDLRRPFLNRFFHVSPGPGITDVVVNRANPVDAIRPIALTPIIGSPSARPENGARRASTGAFNGRPNIEGVLHLLPAGTIPPSAGEFLEHEGISDVLEGLAERFDVVLVDAPPLLAFGDAMTLSAKVDAIFAVTRLAAVQRPLLHELARQLQNTKAPAIGYVLTGVEHGDSYRYMYDAYAYDVRPAERGEQRV